MKPNMKRQNFNLEYTISIERDGKKCAENITFIIKSFELKHTTEQTKHQWRQWRSNEKFKYHTVTVMTIFEYGSTHTKNINLEIASYFSWQVVEGDTVN